MKRDRIVLLVVLVFFCRTTFSAPLSLSVSADVAILMNAETGAVLYEKRGRHKTYPASLTKIATLLHACRSVADRGGGGRFEEKVTCPAPCLRTIRPELKRAHGYEDPPYILETDGTAFGIRVGEILSLGDLLHGMMLVSGNDAANCVAYHIGGTVSGFAEEMNRYVRRLGCSDTRFLNPHGLHHPGHVSTAYDLALITRELVQNGPAFAIFGKERYVCDKTNRRESVAIRHNGRLLQPGTFHYPRVIGMKTGYHAAAGYTLAAVAKEGDRMLIAVVLGCKSSVRRYRDVIRLFEEAFSQEKVTRLLFHEEDPLLMRLDLSRSGSREGHLCRVRPAKGVAISYFPAEIPDITVTMEKRDRPLPIGKGEVVGDLYVTDDRGSLLAHSPLCADEEIGPRGFRGWVSRVRKSVRASGRRGGGGVPSCRPSPPPQGSR
ncbi:MAG: D-alanyl-D-alanine carboxypeptidase [Simkaniaceae bacterium]|nr:D-alanyl-D-alanine carboxypeptidase [Simkaniaceae bacterium]